MGRHDPVVRYAGRKAAAAPATGLAKKHMAEQAALVDSSLTVDNGPSASAPARKVKTTAAPAVKKSSAKKAAAKKASGKKTAAKKPAAKKSATKKAAAKKSSTKSARAKKR